MWPERKRLPNSNRVRSLGLGHQARDQRADVSGVRIMRPKVLSLAFGVACAVHLADGGRGTPANSATVTWVAVADWYFDVGSTRIYMDGALTRFDPNNFYG